MSIKVWDYHEKIECLRKVVKCVTYMTQGNDLLSDRIPKIIENVLKISNILIMAKYINDIN